MKLSLFQGDDQRTALKRLAELAEKNVVHPLVRQVAITLTSGCEARNDSCELEAIFNAVKHGDKRIPGLEKGLRYVADPRWADYFTAPSRLLSQCAKGSCAGDCDDAAGLVAALCASIGFKMGLRAWGPKDGTEYVHVYAVAAIPKRNPKRVVGMDTTVPDSYVGWEPPNGRILTAWAE